MPRLLVIDTLTIPNLAHHFLIHLVRDKLVASAARIIGVTSARIVVVKDRSQLKSPAALNFVPESLASQPICYLSLKPILDWNTCCLRQ